MDYYSGTKKKRDECIVESWIKKKFGVMRVELTHTTYSCCYNILLKLK